MSVIIGLLIAVAVIYTIIAGVMFCCNLSDYEMPVNTKRMNLYALLSGPVAWVVQTFRLVALLFAELPDRNDLAKWANGGKTPNSSSTYWC